MDMRDRSFKIEILRIVLPCLLAIALFIVAVFGIALPAFQRNLMEQKKKMIAVATQTAWNILAFYDRQIKSGEISLEQAQGLAIKQVREQRYGSGGRDYFWINDMRPTMVMHPYRSDLEGQDISNFSDPDGKQLFIEFVNVVRKDGAGYVPYLWQWQDDPKRIVPKLSYVKLFQPWGWIIGTGIYINDVQSEIALVTRELTYISVAILVIIILLLLYIIQGGVKEMRRRQIAEAELKKHHDQLDDLVKERTAELQNALSKVKTLSGFLPICASCKKIRDDRGYWNQIESYVSQHSEAEFSHSICPDCVKDLYPGLDKSDKIKRTDSTK